MKKNKLLLTISLSIVIILCFAGFIACSTVDTGSGTVDYKSEYVWKYDPEFSDPCDENMTIDGVLDEGVWTSSDRNWLTVSGNGARMQYSTYFTKKGLYIAAKVKDDKKLYWNARYNFSLAAGANALNSAFSFTIAGKIDDAAGMFSQFIYSIDAKDAVSYQQSRFTAKATTDVDVDTGNATEMYAELFVTWKSIYADVNEETGMPDVMYIYPQYRQTKDVTNAKENAWIAPLYVEDWRYQSYVAFDENGIASPEAPDAFWGNAGNGEPRSSGWDVSLNASDNTVTSNQAHHQAIFAQDYYTDRYVFSVDMTVENGIYIKDEADGIFRAGVCAETEGRNVVAMLFFGGEMQDQVARVARLDRHSGAYDWTEVFGRKKYPDYDYAARNKTFNITVIKDLDMFYYIVEGELLCSSIEPYFAGKCSPGVYAMSSVAKYSNPKVTDYEGDEAGIRAEIAKYAYRITIPESISGGVMTASKYAVDKTEENAKVTFTVATQTGYVLSSLKVNGTEKIDEVKDIMADGSFELTVTEDMNIELTFSKIDRFGDVIRLQGTFYAEDEKTTVSGAEVKVYDPDNPLFEYKVTTNSFGRFEVSFLKPQDDPYQINAITYSPSGNYVVSVEASGGVEKTYSYKNANDKGIIEVIIVQNQSFIDIQYSQGPEFATVTRTEESVCVSATGSLAFSAYISGSESVQDKSFIVETKISTKYINQWHTYGIAIRYTSGNFLTLGISPRWLEELKVTWLNGGTYGGERALDDTTEAQNVKNNYKSQEDLILDVIYNASANKYYVFGNGALLGQFYANELGVNSSWGEIEKVGFGARLDDKMPSSAEFGSWSFHTEDESEYVAFVNAHLLRNVTLKVENESLGNATLDGVTDGKANLGSTVTVNLETENGAYVTVNGQTAFYKGSSKHSFIVDNDTEVVVRFVNTVTYSVELDKSIDVSKLNVTLNGLKMHISAASGGYTVDVPENAVLTFEYEGYCSIEVSPENGKYIVPAFTLRSVDFAYSQGSATETRIDDGISVSSSETIHFSAYITGSEQVKDKSFVVETRIATKYFSDWNTYGFGIKYSNGKFLTLGVSSRGGRFAVAWVLNGDWMVKDKDVRDATDAQNVKANYKNQEYLTLKVLFNVETNTYYVFGNDALLGELTVSDLGIGDWGDIEKVGFGARMDSGDKIMEFGNWNFHTEDESEYVAFVNAHLLRNVTLKVENESLGNATLDGVTDGKANLGSTVTVNLETENGVYVTVNGQTAFYKGSSKHSFIVDNDTEVVVRFVNTVTYSVELDESIDVSKLRITSNGESVELSETAEGYTVDVLENAVLTFEYEGYCSIEVSPENGKYIVPAFDCGAEIDFQQVQPKVAIVENGVIVSADENTSVQGYVKGSEQVKGKSFIVETAIKTSYMTSLNTTYGFALKYSGGKVFTYGVSLRDGNWKIYELYDGYSDWWGINGSDQATVVMNNLKTYDKLVLRLVYDVSTDTYTLFGNGVLFRSLTANQLKVDTLGEIEKVGFGVRFESDNRTAEFSDWSYTDLFPASITFSQGYYNSDSGNTIAYGTLWKATQMFTRETLPVGSVIYVASGWNYRPEGWVNGKGTGRPGNVSDQWVLVTEEWWGNYTERAFNVFIPGNVDCTAKTQEEMESIFKIYKPNDLVSVSITFSQGYYNSDSGNTIAYGTLWKATQMFTRETLPVGSVIYVASGWNYRPEGWVNGKGTGRPGNVTSQYVEVTEEWWGDYTERAFNVFIPGNVDCTAKTQEEMESIFKIYVPNK